MTDEIKCKCGEVIGHRNTLGDTPVVTLPENYYWSKAEKRYQFVTKAFAMGFDAATRAMVKSKAVKTLNWPFEKQFDDMSESERVEAIKTLQRWVLAKNSGNSDAKGFQVLASHTEIVKEFPAPIHCKNCKTLTFLSA